MISPLVAEQKCERLWVLPTVYYNRREMDMALWVQMCARMFQTRFLPDWT